MGINEVNPQKWMLIGAMGVRTVSVTLVLVTVRVTDNVRTLFAGQMQHNGFFSRIEYRP